MARYQLFKPGRDVALMFGKVAGSLFTKAKKATDESRTLAVTHDALLLRLNRGEIRVKDAERFLEDRGL